MDQTLKEHMRKFLQSVADPIWKELIKEAKTRGVSVQELIRVVIIPHWLKTKA